MSMRISAILDYIDYGHMALPEFQRGYVWNRDQVKGLFDSLYKRHPVGGLLVWATSAGEAVHRGDNALAPGVVKLLLDGQQRITTLYGVLRGKAPSFFDGNEQVFTGLRFHLAEERFAFYQPKKMEGDPLWVDVTQLMESGYDGIDAIIEEMDPPVKGCNGKLNKLLGIKEIELNIEEVTGQDKTIDVVVDIFNRVNSGGTKLSKGDLALAKICADWPDAREEMKSQLKEWSDSGYSFSADWFLRSVNTVLTGEAKFQFLHDQNVEDVQKGFKQAAKHIDTCLNMIGARLGLDHDRVLFGRFAIPVMVNFLERESRQLDEKERDKLVFWFVQAGMWGRFSGSTESKIDADLAALQGSNGLDDLLEQLRLWHGFRAEPDHFTGWSLGARFYPVLYFLTRMGEAKDWGTGLPLKSSMLGKMSKLEVHHIFPKAQLYKRKFERAKVNAIANFCFLTKDTNLSISDRLPEEYFPEIEKAHPGALASQWIPTDPELWKVENYLDFLKARKELLAAELNLRMEELLHGETRWLSGGTSPIPEKSIVGGISSEQEEVELENINAWMELKGLPRGQSSYDYADPETGAHKAILDLAWPNGVQEELSQPVAVLLNETGETIRIANQAGYRCFTSPDEFKQYVEREILVSEE